MSREVDAFDFMKQGERARVRFGDAGGDEPIRGNDSVRSDLVDLTLELRQIKPLAIAVSDPAKPHAAPWVWLPKSEIEFERKGKTAVLVTLPEWLAKQKGLV